MSYSACVHGGMCTGCMDCMEEEEILICADCGHEIDRDYGVYVGNGDVICRECLCARFEQ